METKKMGRVTVEARVDNLKDAWEVEQGLRPASEARSVTVEDALVDTGATTLSLPAAVIEQLGLAKRGERRIRTACGPTTVSMYDAARLTIMGRDCTVDIMEVPDDCPVLIGQIPLECLDFVVDPNSQCLIGNPAHGGEWMGEMY